MKKLVIGLSFVCVLSWAIVGLLFWSTMDDRSMLVGYGCEGSHGPLYAKAEDVFPVCEDIRRVVED